MEFEQTLTFQIAQISTFQKTELERRLAAHGLHAGQIFVLFELWKTDGASQIELAAALKLSPPTINRMVASLVRGGFVVNADCPRDGRVKRVYLTPQGVAVRPQIEETWRKIEERTLSTLTATERLVIAELFGKLSANLSSPAGAPE